MQNTLTLCLNMIVKNESHIIQSTLEHLTSKLTFDYWVICDTGSEDNTPEIITEFFKNKNIKGELYKDEWVNFAHNRTLALERAYKKTNLLLVFDADDEIVGELIMPKNNIVDGYNVKMRSQNGNVGYNRMLIINNHKQFIFKSVVHEYIECKDVKPKFSFIDGDYYVISGRKGSRSLDKNKYLNDALLLESEYQKALTTNDKLFERYAFYCANSYKDNNDFESALKWYDITLSHDKQWLQEKYISCLYAFNCCIKSNQFQKGLGYLVKGLFYDEERVETLFPLLVYYYKEKMYKIAYNYYQIIKPHYETKYLDNANLNNKLFLEVDKYDFYVPYFMICISIIVNDIQCAINMYNIIFKKKALILNETYICTLFSNLKLIVTNIDPANKKRFIKNIKEYIAFLKTNNFNVDKLDNVNI